MEKNFPNHNRIILFMNIDKILTSNQKFVADQKPIEINVRPKKGLVIVTCMDARLVNFLEPALGLERGDASIIKNAGNTLLDKELIRSLAIAVYALNIKEILVIGHSDCGMAVFKSEDIAEAMKRRGVNQESIEKLDLDNWLGKYDDEKENVIQLVQQIKNSPIIPEEITVNGLLIDVLSGKLELLV
jgi:carbonic anhydrase